MVFYDDFLTGCKNTLFSFLLSRTCVIFHKFALENIPKKIAMMKRNIIRTLFAACIASAMIQSCQPLEPSTYTETFFRIGTFNIVKGRPVFYTDYIHESLLIENLKDSADMASFELTDGTRAAASMTLNAIGSMSNNTITLNQVSLIPIRKFEDAKPSDTLNFYYYFAKFRLFNLDYPSIWSEGHILNIAPVCHIDEEKSKSEYYLYPYDFIGDTLMCRLYSDIPDDDVSLNPAYRQTFLCYDMSTIRDAAANADEQILRDTILARLDRVKENQSKITVTIGTPDTLRAKNSKVKDKDGNTIPYLQPVPGLSISTTITLDF